MIYSKSLNCQPHYVKRELRVFATEIIIRNRNILIYHKLAFSFHPYW